MNWIAGKEVMVEKKAYNPAEDHMMQEAVETGAGMVVGEVGGKIAGKVLSKVFNPQLKPLGKGITGRNIANDLPEQLAMEEVQSSPQLGRIIMQNLSDTRWKGWNKLQYTHTLESGKQIVIHYVGKYRNGKLIAVDDFKFK